jgi:hypothetical protein
MRMFAEDDSTAMLTTIDLERISRVRLREVAEPPGRSQIISVIAAEDHDDSRVLNEHLSVQEAPAIGLEPLPI